MNKSSSSSKKQVSVDVEKKPHCVVLLHVDIEPDMVQEEYELALKSINKEVSLPGFRKGKAPRDYILNHFKGSIEKRWKEDLAEKVFQMAIKESSVYPLDRNTRVQLNWKKCELGETASCSFEFETSPEVPVIDISSLNVKVPEVACVCEHEINEELEQLAMRNSHWEDLSSEKPAEGEWVEIEALDSEGAAIYIGKRFEYKESAMPKDLFAALENLKIGESRDVSLKRPGSEDQVQATLKITKILKRSPAKIDDNLAKHLGLSDLEALKARIEKNLKDSTSYEYRSNCFQAIQKALTEACLFEVPESTMTYETRMQENSLAHERGVEADKLGEEELKTFKDEARKRAQEVICQTFLLHKIAAAAELKIEESEVHELMHPFLRELESERDQQRLRSKFQSLYNRCHMHLVAEKALEHIAKTRGWL